ncbi:MAG: YggS family pyridoxal phosphate-dependent enzyme [Clostridia bacterium]|nr:YggS family pyridoxal phosphate-dependent enzyme [Clostridia bacterium]
MRPIQEIVQELHSVNPSCRIVAATKTRTIDEIRQVMDSGLILAAGENRVQEFNEKFTPDFRWDFIGRLQTNKVKYLVGRATLIHSLDRSDLAFAIEKESAKKDVTTDVLVEINAGREEAKGGLFLENLDVFLDEVAALEHLRVRGLMAVAPLDATQDQLKYLFDEVYEKYAKLAQGDFNVLSMGMSNDYLVAAAAGANVVRLGRALFGERRPIV